MQLCLLYEANPRGSLWSLNFKYVLNHKFHSYIKPILTFHELKIRISSDLESLDEKLQDFLFL